MINRKLTPKQQKFADYYIQTGNITQSAISAGYSKNTAAVIGSENLKKPNIEAYIKKVTDKLASERVLTMQEALEFTTSVVRGEITEEVVIGGIDGIKKVVKKADIRDRQRAAEEMIRILSIGNNLDLRNELLKMQIEKTKIDADYSKERTKLLQGTKKDTSLLDALINVVNEDE